MEGKTILVALALVFLVWENCKVISLFRDLLMDFLIGARNRKSAARIYAEQSDGDRLTLAFIGKHIDRYQNEFRFYHRFYLIYLISLIPEAVVVIVMAALFEAARPTRITIYALAGLSFVILVVLRLQFDSMKVSRFAKKRNKR